VSIDNPGREDAVREFIARYGLTFEILHDPQKRIIDDYRAVPGMPAGGDGADEKKRVPVGGR
jgi:peroxiredoxin